MTKKPTKRKPLSSRRIPSGQKSYAPWLGESRTDLAIHGEVLSQIQRSQFSHWPREIEAMLVGLSESVVSMYWSTQAAGRSTMRRNDLKQVVLAAVREGYALAMLTHAGDILEADEAESLYQRREQGGKKGHQSQSQRSQALAQRIREKWAAMEAAGEKVTNDAVVAALRHDGVKVSVRTVQRAFAGRPSPRVAR